MPKSRKDFCCPTFFLLLCNTINHHISCGLLSGNPWLWFLDRERQKPKFNIFIHQKNMALDLSYPFNSLTRPTFRSVYKTITNCTHCDLLHALNTKRILTTFLSYFSQIFNPQKIRKFDFKLKEETQCNFRFCFALFSQKRMCRSLALGRYAELRCKSSVRAAL